MSENTNIRKIKSILTPEQIKDKLKTNEIIQKNIIRWRQTISNILKGKDKRKLVVVGPCSIHDKKAALEYASWLLTQKQKYESKLFIVMRVYFEKPRTISGWKGLINDPDLDNSFKIDKGILLAREILLSINKLNIPCGCEFLDVFTPQYLCDLVSWGSIGARTVESQLHRELASGLSIPIGFKNNTTGNVNVSVNAVLCSKNPHSFIGINCEGKSSIVLTRGNQNGHVILRGGITPNYDSKTILFTHSELVKKNVKTGIVIDCSHGNSQKNHKNQIKVLSSIINFMNMNKEYNGCIKGVMIESNLKEGKQNISKSLRYGQSITDACVGLETTQEMLYLFSNTFLG